MKIKLEFPKNFLWGSGSSANQVEGGIENCDWAEYARMGKLPSVDEFTPDHYHRFKEDFDLAKSLGHNSHRFSIEWARIEPEEGKFDLNEIEHYRKVLLALKDRGITPLVTLWHFTLPLWFSHRGGFEHQNAPAVFARYCAFVADQLKDLCEIVATINEPVVFANNGYIRGFWPPFKKNPFAFMRTVKNLIRGHNLAYTEIKKLAPHLNVGVVKDNIHFTSNKNPFNIILKKFCHWFWNHYFLDRTHKKCDHIGLNYYFHTHFGPSLGFPKNDMGWNIDAEGIYHMLVDLKRYNLPLYVTEAGIPDRTDEKRGGYIKQLVNWTHRAIVDGADIRGFMYWSLTDNYELAHGYTQEFGLIHIDHATRARIIRPSALVYKTICESNALTIE